MRLIFFFFCMIYISACNLSVEESNEQVSEVKTDKSLTTNTLSANSQLPNIVILLADDLGWADLSYRGSDIQTPNIDSLAKEGLTLNRFYSMPICTPTRSALMTGRDPMRLGTVYAGFQPWQNGGVSPEEHFMPETFQAAGYQTAMIGKWHLGHTTEPLLPNSRGFDYFFGHLNTQIDYYDYTVAGGYDLQVNGLSFKGSNQYATDLHAEEAVKFIKEIRDTERPFFMYVPFLSPHAPMQAPIELENKYKSRSNRPFPKRTYAAMVDSLDQAIGDILQSLEEEGLENNTLVFFFSDNGGLKAFGADNSPFKGGKLETFEGGIRVNALMKWPGRITGGSRTNNVVSVLDVYPTLSDLVNIPMLNKKPLDGQSRLGAIINSGQDLRNGDLYFASNSPIFNKYHLAVLEEKWKLVQIIDHKSQSTEIDNFLFDIISDPGEEKNLVKDYPSRVKNMSEKIRKWRSNHPINGVRVALSPHPGWRAPKDYAENVTPTANLQSEGYNTYVSGMRAKILQNRHTDKGLIEYD
ncbi:MAG: sulfatase-like hydrolase/transferase [Hellea sp.]